MSDEHKKLIILISYNVELVTGHFTISEYTENSAILENH